MYRFYVSMLLLFIVTGCYNSSSKPTPRENTYIINNLLEITMVDKENGWAQNNNKLLKTTDGGFSWSTASPENTEVLPGQFFILDTDNAWFVQENEGANELNIYRTTNGGAIWSSNGNIETNSRIQPTLSFMDSKKGYLMTTGLRSSHSSRIEFYSTEDGGDTWIKMKGNIDEFGIKTVIAPIDHQLFISSYFNTSDFPFLYVKNNSDSEWRKHEIRLPAVDVNQPSHYFLDSPINLSNSKYLLFLTREIERKKSSFFLTSSDRGGTWNLKKSFINNVEESIIYDIVDSEHIWVSNGKELWFSDNLFESFQTKLSLEAVKRIVNYDRENVHFRKIDFVSKDVGWIVVQTGNDFRLIKTEDSGTEWKEIKPTLIH